MILRVLSPQMGGLLPYDVSIGIACNLNSVVAKVLGAAHRLCKMLPYDVFAGGFAGCYLGSGN